MLHYLRIAVTVLSLTACVLLIALWVRSYYTGDSLQVRISAGDVLGLGSSSGTCVVSKFFSNVYPKTWGHFEFEPTTSLGIADDEVFAIGNALSIHQWGLNNLTVFTPHWALVMFFAMLVALPWIPYRFSLRTLLIATTLVAIGMGAVIYLSR